ncbi:MAG: SAM-dependent methyltransferase [Desulfobacteraceae bacterium]|nr:SAM-dependent methyltransferase [Desulfobacteraceae bacterium]
MYLGLRSVIYHVNDLQQAKEWYCKVFDTQPSAELPSQIGFDVGNDRMWLKKTDQPSPCNGQGAVAFWAVTDIDAEYKKLIEMGAKEKQGVQHVDGELYAASVIDPFGNTIGIGALKASPDNKTIDEKASRTALWTTLMRAFSFKGEAQDIRCQDNLAQIFLTQEQVSALKDKDNRQKHKETFFVIGVYEYVTARTRIFDNFFKQAVKENFEQIVFLGAGYDSRSYRFKDRIDSIKIFELDAGPTQAHKKQCLIKAGIEIPEQVTLVPINFNTESMDQALASSTFDKNKKTLFIWEGVTFYLSPEAVDATLKFIKSNSLSGSAVAFDYIALWPGIFDAFGVKELIEFNQKNQAGESGNSFALEEGAIGSFLLERGFELSDHLNTKEIENNYLTMKDGSLFGNITGSFRIVRAVTFD